jgi:hypothetical protein
VVTLTQRIEALRKVFRHTRLSRDGCDIAVPCPACKSGEKTKLSINIENLKYHCWVCGAKGSNIVWLVKEHIGEDESQWLSAALGIDRDQIRAEVVEEEPTPDLPEGSIPIVICDSKDPNFRAVKRYCERRGLTESDLWRYRVCWSPADRFQRRAIFTSVDIVGDVNYWVSRSIDADSKMRYINCPVPKDKIIFNEIDVNFARPVCIFEGPFDLIKTKVNGTCLLGSSISRTSRLLSRLVASETEVILCLDRDVEEKESKIADRLTEWGLSVRIAKPPKKYKDFGETPREESIKCIESAKPWGYRSSFSFKLTKISSGSLL